MADKVTKLRKSATATRPQKAQKKEGENKTTSFGEDFNAELARDMERWEKERATEQTAQEEEEEHFPIIPMRVSSSSQPPTTRMNTGPNEAATKRQRTADPKIGATSFQQLFAETTGRRLDDVIEQNVGAGSTQQEIHLTDDL
jgi:hypothetical protein